MNTSEHNSEEGNEMNSYKVFILRGEQFVQQSFFGQKSAAMREAKQMQKLGYEVKIMHKGIEI